MPTRKLLLFDVDATLVHTHGAGSAAMQRAGASLFGAHFSVESLHFGGSLDLIIYEQAAALNRVADHELHHDRFRDAYLAELERGLTAPDAKVVALPGIVETLDLLRRRRDERGDIVLGLLTGNYAAATPIKLRAAGLDPGWFTLGAFGDEGRVRADLTALAMQRYAEQYGEPIAGRDVIVIGDTPRDVQCAKAHDCRAFCVATGTYSREQLLAAGADVVVDDLRDPAPLLALLD